MNPTNSTNPILPLYRYGLTAILVLSFFAAYLDTFARLVRSWASYDEAHTAVLLAIALFLLWTKRSRLKQLSAEPALKSGFLLLMFGCLMLVAGKLSNTKLLQDISLPITISGITLLIGGTRYLRYTWFPIVYLYFVFGLFSAALNVIAIYLQCGAAWTASGILQLTGMPVARHGIILQLPHIVLEVQKGCSGQKHIFALMALAIPIAFSRHRTLVAFILTGVAFFTGVLANGLRIAIIGIWTIDHPGSVHGPHDIFYVSFILFSGMMFFLFASWSAERLWPGSLHKNDSTAIKYSAGYSAPSTRLAVKTSTTCILVLCFTCALLYLWTGRPAVLKQSLSTLPKNLNGWSGEDLVDSRGTLGDTNPDTSLNRRYTHSLGANAYVNIAYFESQNEQKKVVSYRTDWLFNSAEIIPLTTDEGTFFIGKTVVKLPEKGFKTFYFWFDINGRVTANRYKAKIETLLDNTTKLRSNGSIVLVSFPESKSFTDSQQQLFVRQVFPLIRNLLRQTL
jgi:EpsI family protein